MFLFRIRSPGVIDEAIQGHLGHMQEAASLTAANSSPLQERCVQLLRSSAASTIFTLPLLVLQDKLQALGAGHGGETQTPDQNSVLTAADDRDCSDTACFCLFLLTHLVS